METKDICTFQRPPLDEVVLGVQFSVPVGFNAIHFSKVWDLFRNEFPRIEEQPRLEPHFETFGGIPGGQQFSINIGPPMGRNRLLFISSDDSHLLQFQEDRLLLNWRNRDHGTPYPRHHEMIRKFESYLERLSILFESTFSSSISISQAEVTYINFIKEISFTEVGSWIRLLDLSQINAEGFGLSATEVIRGTSGQPSGRMYSEINAAFRPDGRGQAVRWALTVRGKPQETKLASAMEFITSSRDIIVHRFCDLTTESAHEAWGRTE